MGDTRWQNRRRVLFAGFLGLILGIGLSGVLAYIYLDSNVTLLTPRFLTAGRLPRSVVNDPDAAKRDAQALRRAGEVIEAITKKDSEALTSLCGRPFLWGRIDKQRVINDPAEIQRCLSQELMLGWEPKMYAPQRSLAPPLTPWAFLDRYADSMSNMPELKAQLDALQLKESDRTVVEEDRGMMIAIRTNLDSSRVIAIVMGGFQPPSFRLTRDVIYGRKLGTALTLDVIQPKKGGNRAAVLEVVSDTFSSGQQVIGNALHARYQGLLDIGYTLIYVAHSSTPRHPLPEIVADVQRAVRYIRYHAARLDLDPDRIAVMGGSSGGYLALMAGTGEDGLQPFPPAYDPVRMLDRPSDPVDSVSSKANAIVAYFPVTDLLNYGETGKSVLDDPGFHPYRGVFDLYAYDNTSGGFIPVSDRAEQLRQLKVLSPLNRVGQGFPPTLLFHGEKDTHVPVQQSESMARTLKAAGVDVELVVKRNEGHGWQDTAEDQKTLVEWLNKQLLKKNQ